MMVQYGSISPEIEATAPGRIGWDRGRRAVCVILFHFFFPLAFAFFSFLLFWLVIFPLQQGIGLLVACHPQDEEDTQG